MLSKMFTKRVISNLSLSTCSRQLSDKKPMFERSLNQVQLLGRVGNDPQKRGSESHPVVIFSLATHVNYKTEGTITQNTDWHRISVFKPSLRDLVYDYLKKGQRVYVTGRISYGEVKDEEKTTYITSIIAEDIIFFAS